MNTVLSASLVEVLRDYWQLAKPGVISLITFTAVVGMILAIAITGLSPGLDKILLATLGISLAAAGAAAANCLLERRLDALMIRTRNRATAAGRIWALPALIYAFTLCASGLTILNWGVNSLTMWLTLGTFIGYAFIYTVWLKPATPQNIVIGGAAGAMPPVLGWTAVTGMLTPEPLLLSLIIFVWTPPHFWSLALYRVEDYRKSCIPMMPVTHGLQYTRLQILLYSLALLAVSILPYAVGMVGLLYLACALLAGCAFIRLAWEIWCTGSNAAARRLFAFSGFYLLAIFSALLGDAVISRLI